MATTEQSISTTWSLLKTGPTFLPVSVFSPTIRIQIYVASSLPLATTQGIGVLPGDVKNINLADGYSLYVRSTVGSTTVMYNDGNGLISENGICSALFNLELAKGNIGGHSSEFKFSRSGAIGTTESVIWDNGGDYTWITSAETMDVVSTSTNDTAAGTGARTVYIAGLDANYEEVSEIITMNGTTDVVTTKEYLRVYRALVVTSGTDSAVSDGNLGDITVTGSTSSTLMAKVLIGNGQTLMSPYTVPAGKTAYVTGASFSVGEGKQCTITGKFRNAAQTSGGAFSIKYVVDVFESTFAPTFFIPLKVPEKTDMCFTASTTVGTVDASASYGIVLVEN